MHTKDRKGWGKVRAQYRWAYATSTLLPLQEIGKNQHEKGGGLIIRHGRIIRILLDLLIQNDPFPV